MGKLTAIGILPRDENAMLVGRVWSARAKGPCLVLVERSGLGLRDITPLGPTMAQLLERDDLLARLREPARFEALGPIDDFLRQAPEAGGNTLLAPCDLQAVKAAGVTFVDSMLERVIEEKAGGDASRAQEVRARLAPVLGSNLRGLQPGSEKARQVKSVLQDMGMWSQYLEVGIGPDAEIFTKTQPMASVGVGAEIGIHPNSHWNNPEPELVLAVRSDGRIVGATLGNDVNLRDVEGRSALLLGKAKDNNASCSIGPFIRLLDEHFTIDSLTELEISLEVKGQDGFVLQGSSSMGMISRKPEELARQALNRNHQYPDGMMLFLGTMFAPVKDRFEPGQGFTHAVGDMVTIATPALGALINRVNHTDQIAPWTFGSTALLRNLAERGLLGGNG